MSVKLAKYVFRRIKGRIVPIRAKLQMASDDVSRIAAKAPANYVASPKIPGVKALGTGVDFKVFPAGHSEVVKIPRATAMRQKMAKYVTDKFPFLKDPVARAVGGAGTLPNYGVETVGVKKIRLTKHTSGILQQRVTPGAVLYPHIQRDAIHVARSSGLDIDPHAANISDHGLIDAAIGMLPTKKSITYGDYSRKWARGVQGTGNKERGNPNIARGILEDMAKEAKRTRHEVITERAALETASAKALRKLNAALKRGSRLKQTKAGQFGSYDEFKLVSKQERVQDALSKGVTFRRVNGKLKAVRPKRGG